MSRLLDVVFPGRCLICGGELLFAPRPFYPVCRQCLGALTSLAGRRCRVCSRPLVSEDTICTLCREREYHFDTNFSLFEYRGKIRDMVRDYKFGRRKRLGGVIADLFAAELRLTFEGIPIVPVPARPGERRKRGWAPVDLICRPSWS